MAETSRARGLRYPTGVGVSPRSGETIGQVTRRSTLILPSTLIALGLTLSACGGSDTEDSGSSEGTAPGAGSETTTAAPAGDADADSETVGSLPQAAPESLSLDLVPGATLEEDVDDELGLRAEWVVVPEADALNEAVEAAVQDAWTALEDEGVEGEGLVRAAVIASGPGVVGVHVMAYEDDATSDAVAPQTLWWDGSDLVENTDLFAEEADLEVVVGELSARLGVSGYPVSADTDLPAELTAVRFDERGDVLADVRESAISGEGDRVVSVYAPARQTLSEFGEAAREGVNEPAEYAAE